MVTQNLLVKSKVRFSWLRVRLLIDMRLMVERDNYTAGYTADYTAGAYPIHDQINTVYEM